VFGILSACLCEVIRAANRGAPEAPPSGAAAHLHLKGHTKTVFLLTLKK